MSLKPPPQSDFPLPDPLALVANLARAGDRAARIAGLLARHPLRPPAPGLPHVILQQMAVSLAAVATSYARRPDRLVQAQLDLIQGHGRILQGTMHRLLGGSGEPAGEPVIAPSPRDRRFRDPDWQRNHGLEVLRQSYLLTVRWAQNLVAEAEVDEPTRRKAAFYVDQIANALAPTNFIVSNPDVVRLTLATSGANLVRGLERLADDIAASGTEFTIRHTDRDAFEVGRDLAATPGKVVYQNELMQLIQYAPTTETVFARPLLIVPPWINKYYVLDLAPERSFVRWAVAQGLTVFIISWVNPDGRLAHKSFADYMRQGVLAALDAIGQAIGARQINALGYCIGGTLLAATLARMAAAEDRRVSAATLLAAQVDFHEAGDLLVFLDEEHIAALERHMAAKGYLEGRRMAQAFNVLRSNDLIWAYVIDKYLKGNAPRPIDLLYWNSDTTRMPAAMQSFYMRECYLNNALAGGRMVLDGVRIDLKEVKVPVYNLAARNDHIAPLASVIKVGRHLGGPTRLVVAGSGHVAGIVNPPEAGKSRYWTNDAPPETASDWLDGATEHAGSWWPDWMAWIAAHSGRRVKARQPGSGKLKAIEDAPGSYVKVKGD